jgi:hypothetical protein
LGTDLYYALGGGLGHLTRARAAQATLGVQARVLALSPHVEDPELVRGLDLLPVSADLAGRREDLTDWLGRLLWKTRPGRLYLDSFPCGILGELCGLRLPPDLEVHYLARLLRWDRYARRIQGPPPLAHRVHLLEPLSPAHADWLAGLGASSAPLVLKQPDLPPPAQAMARLAGLKPPRWLVVHSGPAEEVRELLSYAQDVARAEGVRPSLVLIAPQALGRVAPAVLRLHAYPARYLFPLAERIVTACGFNAMTETDPYRPIHRFLPMPRALDDQYARAAERRGRLTATEARSRGPLTTRSRAVDGENAPMGLRVA